MDSNPALSAKLYADPESSAALVTETEQAPKVFCSRRLIYLLFKIFQGVVVVVAHQPIYKESVGNDKAILRDARPFLPRLGCHHVI